MLKQEVSESTHRRKGATRTFTTKKQCLQWS
jgi:hypothetical protein